MSGSPVKEILYDLIVVLVGRKDEGCDVWCEGGRVTVRRLPALYICKIVVRILTNDEK